MELELIIKKLELISKNQAQNHNGTADVVIHKGYLATINDETLYTKILPSIKKTIGKNTNNFKVANRETGAEDFSFFANEVPGIYIFLGVTPEDQLKDAKTNHSPYFFADESALAIGVRLLTQMTVDYFAD